MDEQRNMIDRFEEHLDHQGSSFVIESSNKKAEQLLLPLTHRRSQSELIELLNERSFQENHSLFCSFIERFGGSTLYQVENSDDGLIEIFSAQQFAQEKANVLRLAEESGMEVEITSTLENAIVFAKTVEDHVVYYRFDSEQQGYVYLLQTRLRWEDKLISLSFDSFLEQWLDDPFDFLQDMKLGLEYKIGRKKYHAVAYVEADS